MTERDREYYSRRRQECLTQAAVAKDSSVARVHLEFADHYAKALNPAGDVAAR